MEKIDRHFIYKGYNDGMAKRTRTVQTNERWTEEEHALVEAKAKFHGMSRSEWIRTTALNAELKVTMPEELRKS